MDTVENPDNIVNKVKKPKKEKTPEQILKKQQKKEKRKDLNELAFERIRVVFERLQLAWIRAAITFIALGFAAYKFYIGRVESGGHPLMKYANGRGIGMFLIGVGFLGLLLATFQHIRNQARLKKHYPEKSYSVALLSSYFILLLSLLLFLVLIFRG